MNKKMSKRRRDIKSKLMAAICMLLVSSIMMVSTTYAWFTLSTAPEVTGIQTAVGANGNLEMALLSPALQETDGTMKAGWGDLIASAVGDSSEASGKTVEDANITWGNLVDVSNRDTYGLQNINLYPSQLTAAANGDGDATIGEFPLSHPTYGADGRIIELKADTLTASYRSGKFSAVDALGVRAVGTASSMTAREIAHRQILADAATAASAAKTAARGTLERNGNVLAAMAIKKVGGGSDFTQDDMDTLATVLDDLSDAQDYIEKALKLYVVAHNIAPANQDDSTYQTIYDTIMGTNDTPGMSLEALKNDTNYEKPDGFDAAYDALVTSRGRVTTATSKLGEATAPYDWDEISAVLNKIMDYNQMLLCGLTMDDATKYENGAYVNASIIVKAMGAGGLKLQMQEGSGVFADIADFCGTYTAGITFPVGTKVMGVDIGGVEATMITDKPHDPLYLTPVRNDSDDFEAAEGGDSGTSITDYYGYIVDLGFRTNAASSNLMLQAKGIDRVYEGNTANEATMGGGATMTFTGSENFGAPMVQALMSSIRIVFFETDTSVILGEARLNPATAEIDNVTVTMEMAMWDPEGGAGTGDFAATQAIVALEQNKAKAISVLVYLDGASVKNADVATTGTNSMTGKMNLQFSSSAELNPMVYTDLKDGKSSASNTPSDTPVISAVTTGTVTGATSATVNHIAVGTTYKYVAVITGDDDAAVTDGTVTIGGVNATYGNFNSMSGWVADAPAEVPASVDVVVTPVTPNP